MPNLRRAPLAVAATATVAVLAGCSPTGTTDPVRTYQPPETRTTGTTGTPGPLDEGTEPGATIPAKLAGPLTAADLGPGWVDAADTPAADADWVTACGTGTGVADRQQTARTVTLTGPGGVEVRTRVAGYRAGETARAVAGAEALFTNCPLDDVAGEPGGRQTTALMAAEVAGQDAVGATVTRVSAAGTSTEIAGYWIVPLGDSTVEVYARGQFTSPASEPMATFAGALRDATVAKALGEPIPSVGVPVTAADGAPQGPGRGPSLADSGHVTVPEPIPGVGGETGPGVIGGP